MTAGEQKPVSVEPVPQVRLLLDQWTAGLAQVLESMTDQKPEVSWQPGALPSADGDILWWEQPFQAGPETTVWVAAPHATWEHAGTLTLKAAGLETVEAGEARNTWLEILGQSLSVMARSIGALLGREVVCEAGKERPPESSPDAGGTVTITFGETSLAPLWIGFSDKLVSLVSAPATQDPAETNVGRGTPELEKAVATRPAAAPATMELLLDVELPVSISFGKTQILMKDVLKLTTGSIVELNRTVGEPVEVLVNHCLIARGEVVVVEGNYGVRILHIASRQDRMRSIK
jgi:flagellar motor switch protein FliN